jgi:hypothetical protein
MSEVRMVPRFLVLLAAALVTAACASRPSAAPINTLRANPCATGKVAENKQAPIVCIDDSARTLVAYPDPVVIHDVMESDRTTPVTVQWFTKSGTGDVQVAIEPGCIEKKECNRNGKCTAKTVKGANKRCKYDVWIEGDTKHERLDPVVVITTCC